MTAEEQARLLEKGRLLVVKSCGMKGQGDCAEGFAAHQLRLGNDALIATFVDWLEMRLTTFDADDPDGLRESTERLIRRIRIRMSREIR